MAQQDTLTLLSGATSTGSGSRLNGFGYWNWVVYGTFNSSTAQLQWSPDNGTTWIDIDGADATVNGGFSDIPIDSGMVRVSITGTATSVSSTLGRVK
jgi:hypothetical protein